MMFIKGLFWVLFSYHGNGWTDKRCEGWFINGVVACRQTCFVSAIIKGGYGQIWDMEKCSRRLQGLRVNVDKTSTAVVEPQHYLKVEVPE